MEIGQKIKRIRLFLEMNQTEFAEKVGITHGALSKIESNKVEMSLPTLRKIAELYNISTDWLLLDRGEPPKIFEWDQPKKAFQNTEGFRA